MRTALLLAIVMSLPGWSTAATTAPIQRHITTAAAATGTGRLNGGQPSRAYKRKSVLRAPTTNSVICPEEPCGGEENYIIEIWSGWVTDLDAGQAVQTIEVTGARWSDGWSTACTGNDCSDFLEGQYMQQPQKSWIVERYIDMMDVREIDVPACSNVARQPTPQNRQTVGNTTSKSSDGDRLAAANAIWGGSTTRQQAVQSLTGLATSIAYGANNGFDVTITFSDGGTEVYKAVIGPSQELTKVDGSLKQGNGVSQCPQ